MDLEQELCRRGITIRTGFGMDKDGLYLPDIQTIFINANLSQVDRENAILHELGHLVCQHDQYKSQSPSVHIRQEHQADRYMMEIRVEEYLDGFDSFPDRINIDNFLRIYHLKSSYFDLAEQAFKEALQG